MTPAEAIKVLDLLPHSTPEQIEARFVEQRTLLEDKAARALTPKLQAQYREALGRITEAYETLVLAEESATLPSLQPVSGPAPAASVHGAAPGAAASEAAAAAIADRFWPSLLRQTGGLFRAGLAFIVGAMLVAAVFAALDGSDVLPKDETILFVSTFGAWVVVGFIPGLIWRRQSIRLARQQALVLAREAIAQGRVPLPIWRRRSVIYSSVAVLTVAVVLGRNSLLDLRQRQLAEALVAKGEEAKAAKDWEGAIQAYQAATEIYPSVGSADYYAVQQGWLDGLSVQSRKLNPAQAYPAIAKSSARTKPWLEPGFQARSSELLAASLAKAVTYLEQELERIQKIADDGKFAEARDQVDKLRPLARLVPGFQAAVAKIDSAEFDAQVAPVEKAAEKGDYDKAYALWEKLEAKSDAARRRKKAFLVELHLSQFVQCVLQTAHLTQQGDFIKAQDKFVEMDVIARRTAALEGYAEVMKEKNITEAELTNMTVGARKGWRQALERQTATELGEALTASDARRAQAILAGYAAVQGYESSPITGEALVGEKFFPQFIEYLAILNLGRTSLGDPDSLPAVALAQAALPQFTDQELPRHFLAENYHALAKMALKSEAPGVAIYLQREAVRAGGVADEALETAALKLFAESNAVHIIYPSFVVEGDQASRLAESVREATRKAIETASQGLVVLEDGMVDDGDPRQVVLQGTLTGIETGRGRNIEKKVARNPSGENTLPNAAYSEKKHELEALSAGLTEHYRQRANAEHALQTAIEEGNKVTIENCRSYLEGVRNLIGRVQAAYTARLRELGAIPATRQEINFVEVPYRQVNHHRNHALAMELSLKHGAHPETSRQLAAWTAALRYSTVEIAGGVQSGVAVQEPVFLPESEVGRQLEEDLKAKTSAQARAVLWQLAQGIYAMKVKQLQANSKGGRLPSDFEWGWVAFWEKCGMNLKSATAEAAVREDLGLPLLAANKPEAFVPPAGWQSENSLGMRFSSLPGTNVQFSIWEARVQDFLAFVNETGYAAKEGMRSLNAKGWDSRGDNWWSPGFKQDGSHPVCGVSWHDARAFCSWLTKKERAAGQLAADREYRLPTVAEWQAAAAMLPVPVSAWPAVGAGNLAGIELRDGSAPADFPVIAGYADGFARTAPVGWFSSTPLGIYDLEGNVAEWCQPDVEPTAGEDVPTMGSSFVTAESESAGKEPRKARAMPEMRFGSQGFRVVVAPVAAK